MFVKLLLVSLLSCQLLSLTLQKSYYVDSKRITLQDVIPEADPQIPLYEIEPSRYTKKVKSEELSSLLNSYGYDNIEPTSRYVKFVLKSPINTLPMQEFIQKSYQEHHPSIVINSLRITPRGFIDSLPKKYQIHLPKKFFLYNEGTFSIETLDKKRIFFDYIIDATVMVFHSKEIINKKERLSLHNTTKKRVQLNKFKSLPINEDFLEHSQLKRKMRDGAIIYTRDIEALTLVKRGSNVNVSFQNSNLNISFSARALQNGKLNDIITIQKQDKKRFRAKVIGKNRVELNGVE